MNDPGEASRRYWDRAAAENAAWYIATGYTVEDAAFFEQGAAETDALLQLCGVTISPTETVLEIGCGVGRMTRRLAELAGGVVATDVSEEMLRRCRANLADSGQVTCLLVPGDGTIGEVATASIGVVFSYITLQHVPTADAQLRYLRESSRVLGSGGRLAIQVRGTGWKAHLFDWAGHVHHLVMGRSTLNRAWRGARLSNVEIARAFEGSGVEVRIVAFDQRHRWVVGTRAAGVT